MKTYKTVIIVLICFFVFSCGLDEYYYLPQVPQDSITTNQNTEAILTIPSLTQSYATKYAIYYRIYISGQIVDSFQTSSPFLSNINQDLERDFSTIFQTAADPTNTSSITSVNSLFINRGYFELELDGADAANIFSTGGGTFRFRFPTATFDSPVLIVNEDEGQKYPLRRCSTDLISPEPDMFFRNTAELNDPAKATLNINADVASRTGLALPRYAYVSMYILAVGLNPVDFTPIYSKPTHICIFKLPDAF
jgi:hypothetical protein